jgi:hypothetical protein
MADSKASGCVLFEVVRGHEALDVSVCGRSGHVQMFGDFNGGYDTSVFTEHVENLKRSLSG